MVTAIYEQKIASHHCTLKIQFAETFSKKLVYVLFLNVLLTHVFDIFCENVGETGISNFFGDFCKNSWGIFADNTLQLYHLLFIDWETYT